MKERIIKILSNLKNVQEDLLALSDDLWLEIDHNDNESIENGVQFKSKFNASNKHFTEAANALSVLIQHYTNTPLYQQEDSKDSDQTPSEHGRIIKELNKKEPHKLTEDFKYKRPYGFVLKGTACSKKFTWSELYIQFCTHLCNLDQKIFDSLESNQDHITNRNNKYFSKKPNDLRSPQKCGSSTGCNMKK